MCNSLQISLYSRVSLCPVSVPLTSELSMTITPMFGTNKAQELSHPANLDILVSSPPQYEGWGHLKL